MLLGVNLGLLLDDPEDSSCGLLGLGDARHLTDGDSAADSAHKDDVAARENLLSLSLVKLLSLHEQRGHKEHKSNEHKTDRLRVAEE